MTCEGEGTEQGLLKYNSPGMASSHLTLSRKTSQQSEDTARKRLGFETPGHRSVLAGLISILDIPGNLYGSQSVPNLLCS